MNEQEAFDKGVAFLFEQGIQCIAGTGSCYYRHPHDSSKKCFVGALIPDDQYSKDLELLDPRVVFNEVPALDGLDKKFLIECQSIHDSHGAEKWKAKFKDVAEKWALEWKFEDLNIKDVGKILTRSRAKQC